MKIFVLLCLAPIMLVFNTLILLITMRTFLEARYIPSTSMVPSFVPNDRLILEKSEKVFGKEYKRGDVIVFYAPKIWSGKGIDTSIPGILGQLTGLNYFPREICFIKRIVGVPGDVIKLVQGEGLYINGKLQDESAYTQGKPLRTVAAFSDIGGYDIDNKLIEPYRTVDLHQQEIVVGKDQLFVLSDDRTVEIDSRTYGPIERNSIIGRAAYKVWPRFGAIPRPTYR